MAWKNFILSQTVDPTKNLDVTSYNSIIDLSVSSDGTKLYIYDNTFLGGGTKTIYQYILSTPYDISTASYNSKSFLIDDASIFFIMSNDGTKLYRNYSNSSTIYQYTLSTAWDISTTSYDSKSVTLGEGISCQYIQFNQNGTILYAIQSGTIYQYTLSTAWDISTVTYDNKSILIESYASNRFNINSTGDRIICLVNGTPDIIKSYLLSTAWDISTATYDNQTYNLTNSVYGFLIDDDGNNLYFSDDGDYIRQYYLNSFSTITGVSTMTGVQSITF